MMEEMMPLVYDELRRIAASKLRYERPDHALSPTMLVHETWLEVSKLDRITWQNRSHYLAIAVQAMRRILIDYAVARKRQKRGGGQTLVSIQDDVRAQDELQIEDEFALDQALVRLKQLNARQAWIVECRFFGGMTVDETAETLNVSTATVKREWAAAREWLKQELGTGSRLSRRPLESNCADRGYYSHPHGTENEGAVHRADVAPSHRHSS